MQKIQLLYKVLGFIYFKMVVRFIQESKLTLSSSEFYFTATMDQVFNVTDSWGRIISKVSYDFRVFMQKSSHWHKNHKNSNRYKHTIFQ